MLQQPTFGQQLRALRLKQGLTQAELAGEGMSTGYLSRLESGMRRPTKRVVSHLAQRLGVPVSAFDTPSSAENGSAGARDSSVADLLAGVISANGDDDALVATLAEALEVDEGWSPALRWQALWLLARSHDAQGRHKEQHPVLVQLVTLSDELGTPTLRARAYTELSRCVRQLGDNVAAREHASRAVQVAAELSMADRAAALLALVSAEAELGLLAEARIHSDELCELTEQAPGALLVEALWAAATVRIRQGDYAGAQTVLERALRGLDSHHDLALWIRLRLAAASLYLQITPALIDRAHTHLDEVAPLIHVAGSDLRKQQLSALQAHLAYAEGRLADARALCAELGGQALSLSFRDRTRLGALCGRLRVLDGDREGGIHALQQLAEQAQEARNVELAAEMWRLLAETLAADAERAKHAAGRRSGDGRQTTRRRSS